MPEGHQHDLLLLLARDLAANLATAFFIMDPDGRLVFYNERAEELLGRPFSEARLDPENGMRGDWKVTECDGTPIRTEDWPIVAAVRERRPTHRTICLTALDGERRTLAATAFPLIGTAGALVGACSIFWEDNGDR